MVFVSIYIMSDKVKSYHVMLGMIEWFLGQGRLAALLTLEMVHLSMRLLDTIMSCIKGKSLNLWRR